MRELEQFAKRARTRSAIGKILALNRDEKLAGRREVALLLSPPTPIQRPALKDGATAIKKAR